jgi:hypothetical protein
MVKDSNDTDRELSLDWVMKDYCRVEFLFLVNIVISELDLQLASLREVSLFLLSQGSLDVFGDLSIAEFVHRFIKY